MVCSTACEEYKKENEFVHAAMVEEVEEIDAHALVRVYTVQTHAPTRTHSTFVSTIESTSENRLGSQERKVEGDSLVSIPWPPQASDGTP